VCIVYCRYQTNWVIGAHSAYNITVDYIGIWNERPWGTPAYVKALRASLDAAGFTATQIVLSPGHKHALGIIFVLSLTDRGSTV
jgi:galactosylceramidase